MVNAYMSLNLDAIDVDSHLEKAEDLQNLAVTEPASTGPLGIAPLIALL
jgi:hypothetical protein